MASIDGTGFSTVSGDTAKGLTRVMVLHPVACGVAFIAFLLALGSGFIGALLAAVVSAVAWIVSLVVLVTDFVAFGIVKNNVNKDGTGSSAKFGPGIWTLLAAMILLFFATFIVLFSCCSSRRHRNDVGNTKEAGYVGGTTTTRRRHFWQRKNRY
jgi:Na+/H+-dicarboxylate symporter